MRVPDVFTTAGYAASLNLKSLTYQQENNTDTSGNSFGTAFGDERNNINNLQLFGDETSSTQEYSSSAEEFVRKALNPENCSNYKFRDETTHYWFGLPPQQLKHSFVKYCDNEVVENTTAIYEDIKKIATISNGKGNSEGIADNYTECDTYQDRKSLSLCQDNSEIGSGPKIIYAPEQYENQNFDRESNEPDDNDYDDQYIDLGSETKSIYDTDDRDDIFLTSSSSSSDTLQTPCLYFPRGIINPNYPGFQHLAHTLSEHFRNSSPFESYDTDMSDDELEFKAGSLDSLVEDMSQTHLNIFNNNILHCASRNSNNDEDSIEPMGMLEQGNVHVHNGHVAEREYDDKSYEAVESFFYVRHNNNILPNCSNHNRLNNEKLANTQILCDAPIDTASQRNISAYSPTPDILIKHLEGELKKENRPDLLSGVSPQLLRKFFKEDILSIESDTNATKTKQSKLEKLGSTGLNVRNQDPGMQDEMPPGLTPVNIIGDFGLEVEREFGLLVSGYKRLVDAKDKHSPMCSQTRDKTLDATLSKANDEINSTKCLPASNTATNNDAKVCTSIEMINDNAIYMPRASCQTHSARGFQKVIKTSGEGRSKPKYKKSSYDDRQLPPVAIEYKRCQQTERFTKKSHSNVVKSVKSGVTKVQNEHENRSNLKRANKIAKNDALSERKREEHEFRQYQRLVSQKDQILSNSKYTKLSLSWAQHLKDCNRSNNDNIDASSPSALELIDAYKIGTEIDVETLEQHIKMAKEIEKKRRSNREEIRRRLAMGAEGNTEQNHEPKSSSQVQTQNDLARTMELSSDTETNSSDSETCPKLSKFRKEICPISTNEASAISNKALPSYQDNAPTFNGKIKQQQGQLKSSLPNVEDKECDFFTKQARLQIEARMSLAQAKELARMQMEINRQSQRMSPITVIIRSSLEQIGIQTESKKRRVSRHMLTELNAAQLQILVNNLQTHITELNETLVNYLLERDDLHVNQDSMFVDIEELTRYIGAKEHIIQQERLKTNSAH